MYRNEYGKQRFLTIAKTTEITPEEAKKIAAGKLLLIKQGSDPAKDKVENRKAMTISELIAMLSKHFRFLSESCNTLKFNRISRSFRRLI